MALTKEQILEAQDIQREEVEVPEWGGTVYVKALTADERDKLESAMVEWGRDGKPRSMKIEGFRLRLAAMSICDEDGGRLFGDNEVTKLGKKSSAALERVLRVAERLSSITQSEVEELADGLKNDQSADSPSD